MYDKELVRETIQLLEKTLEILLKRVSGITSVHDFLDTENGVILLDSVCMKLIAVGESVKNLDKITDKELLDIPGDLGRAPLGAGEVWLVTL